ncbi:type II toxin-antitoxin system VapC family toxin [Sporolituus thermophilus]|uniref:PIN domain-containing protein n=1 Tax=Sporolituus thermophilus DSM 23256 TaxID=1123285 RepID=A0A1G7NAQ0_9FIRM|nr:hypothetical protein [Sporolituus thermophilus]SDF71138.1 hypothetical protein SAMN05660235_02487 [Sporolituus thermophilus DSM 23256]
MAVAIARRLDRISTIALDTNCFIYFFEDNQYADILQVIFDKIQSGQLRGFASALTLTEVLTLPKGLKNYELENAYCLLLKKFPQSHFSRCQSCRRRPGR